MKISKIEDNNFVFKARIELGDYYEQFKNKIDTESGQMRDTIINTLVFCDMQPKLDITKERMEFIFSAHEKSCIIEVKKEAKTQKGMFVLAKLPDDRVGFIINIDNN